MANWWDAHRDSEGFREALAKFGLMIEDMDQDPGTFNGLASNQNEPIYWLKRTLEIYGEMDQGIYNIPVVEPFENGIERQGHLFAGQSTVFATNIFMRPGDKLTIKIANDTEEVTCFAVTGADFIKGAYVDDDPNEYFLDDFDLSNVKPLVDKETIYEAEKEGTLLLSCIDQTNREMKHIGKKVRIEVSGGNNDYPIYIFGITPAWRWSEISRNPNPYNQVQMFNGRIRMYVTGDKAANSSDIDINEMMQQFLLLTTLYDFVNGLDNSSHLHASSQGLQVVVFGHGFSAGYAKPSLIGINWYPDKIEAKTGWGDWHEWGHQSQMGWTWSNQLEITVNIYSIAACGFFKGANPNLKEACHPALNDVNWDAETVQNFMSTGNDFKFDEPGAGQEFVLLIMYIQLGSSYGDYFYPELNKAFRDSYYYGDNKEKFATDENKKDWFVVNASRVAGQDLRGFFDQWGLGYSQAARDEIEALMLSAPDGGTEILSGTEGHLVESGITLSKDLNIVRDRIKYPVSVSFQIDTEKKAEPDPADYYIYDRYIGLVVEPPAEGPRELTRDQELTDPSYDLISVELKNEQGSNFWIKLRGIKTSVCSENLATMALSINSFNNCPYYKEYPRAANNPNSWRIVFYLEDNPDLPEGRYTGTLNLTAKSETGDWLQPIKVNINYN